MPTKKQVQKVIDNFKKVLPMAIKDNHLMMMEGDVNMQHKCGTVHCHGGWYAIAVCNLKEPLDFTAGANRMAQDLGFENMGVLENWANEYPLL